MTEMIMDGGNGSNGERVRTREEGVRSSERKNARMYEGGEEGVRTRSARKRTRSSLLAQHEHGRGGRGRGGGEGGGDG